MISERRRFSRHKPKRKVYIIFEPPKFSLFPTPKSTFTVVDISPFGLHAHYVSSEMFDYKTNKISIESEDGVVKIEHIPFKIISDYPFTRISRNTHLRKCGLKFVNLSEYQKKQINQLIRDYA